MPRLAPDLVALLADLRFRIRAYIWVEGLALLIACAGALFWIGFLLDYGPVLAGANEMPPAARLVILSASLLALGTIFYIWIIQRAFEPLSDRSMALLLERRHRDLHDSLLTSVELSEEPEHAADFSREMLEHTTAEARERAPSINIGRVFNTVPLWINCGLAFLAIASLAAFALADAPGLKKAVEREIGLSAEPWERSATIQIVGIEVQKQRATTSAATPDGQPAASTGPRYQRIEFGADRSLKVAKGAGVRLIVHADTTRPAVPDTCVIIYSSDQTSGATVEMRKVAGRRTRIVTKTGEPLDEKTRERIAADERYARILTASSAVELSAADKLALDKEYECRAEQVEEYVYDGSPFKSVLSSLHFDVLGYSQQRGNSSFLGKWPVSNRVQDYRIEVVDSPALNQIIVYCEYPGYLGRAAEPRPLTAGMLIPVGTKVTLRATATKPLRTVELFDDKGVPSASVKIPENATGAAATSFSVPLGELTESIVRDIYLTDADGVTSQKAQRIVIGALPDETPRVEMALKGIGSAVTPQVILRAAGSILDDYAIDRVWTEIELLERDVEGKKTPQTDPPRAFPIAGTGGEKVAAELDLREESRRPERPFTLLPKDKIAVTFRAADKRTVGGKPDPNVGASEKVELEVVTGEELLRILEGRELGLRQRFERIVEEMNQSRDSLVRVRSELEGTDGDGGADPADKLEKKLEPKPNDAADKKGGDPGDEKVDPAAEKERLRSLRSLRVQRGAQHAQRSAEEVRGVAVTFDDLSEELENNRVEAEDRKTRYREEIANPLKVIADKHLPELNRRLDALEAKLDDPSAAPLAAAVQQQADLVLLEMNKVLQKMLEYETYNELVDTLRKIITDQNELIQATKHQQAREALGLGTGPEKKQPEKPEPPKDAPKP